MQPNAVLVAACRLATTRYRRALLSVALLAFVPTFRRDTSAAGV